MKKPVKPLILRPALDVRGLDYDDAVLPGRKVFSCQPYRAVLSQDACGARWRGAQTATGYQADRLSLCRGCSIGAQHAGYEPITYSRHFKAPVCPRCRKGTLRMIGDRMCVSCYNRRAELARGVNARGNVPVRLLADKPLHTVRFRLIVNGHTFKKRADDCVDLLEPMLQTLRTTKGELAFAFSAVSPAIRQGRLF